MRSQPVPPIIAFGWVSSTLCAIGQSALEDRAGVNAVKRQIEKTAEIRTQAKLNIVAMLAVMSRDSHERKIGQLAINLYKEHVRGIQWRWPGTGYC